MRRWSSLERASWSGSRSILFPILVLQQKRFDLVHLSVETHQIRHHQVDILPGDLGLGGPTEHRTVVDLATVGSKRAEPVYCAAGVKAAPSVKRGEESPPPQTRSSWPVQTAVGSGRPWSGAGGSVDHRFVAGS
jgi:hypothetical protein